MAFLYVSANILLSTELQRRKQQAYIKALTLSETYVSLLLQKHSQEDSISRVLTHVVTLGAIKIP
jgi:hypothetical protein